MNNRGSCKGVTLKTSPLQMLTVLLLTWLGLGLGDYLGGNFLGNQHNQDNDQLAMDCWLLFKNLKLYYC